MPPEDPPYLYKCPHCKKLFYDRETAKNHIKEKHYNSITRLARVGASFFNWEPDGSRKDEQEGE